MSDFRLTLPAWFLVCSDSLVIDRASGTGRLVDPVKFPSVEWEGCVGLPVFSNEEAARRHAREGPVPATPVLIQTREEFLDLLEQRKPAGATHVVFDPVSGGTGFAVPVAEAIRALRG